MGGELAGFYLYTYYMSVRLVQLISHLICHAPAISIETKPLILNAIKLLLYNIVSTEIEINSFGLQLWLWLN